VQIVVVEDPAQIPDLVRARGAGAATAVDAVGAAQPATAAAGVDEGDSERPRNPWTLFLQ
jgi:hypothetical protein